MTATAGDFDDSIAVPALPLNQPTDTPQLRRDLAGSVGDGTAFGVMVGIGETYVPAFMLAVGLGEVFAGLIASVPLLLGSVLQMISPWAVQRLQSHRRWVVLCSGLQAACFVPLVVAALQGRIAPWWAMTVAAVYWGAGLATGPAWNTWQGTIIPRAIRANFFARRSRWQQIATLLGFVIGGFSLQVGRASHTVTTVFAMLFLTAAVCRALSMLCLAMQSEPAPMPAGVRWLTLGEQWERFTGGSTGRLLVFAVAMQAGVYVSGPFFNPYILKVLKFSYAEYATLLGASFVAKFLCLPLWGRFAHVAGAQRLLWVGAVCIIPLAAGWNVSSNFWWLTALQLYAGAAWGAYELALVLLFFETIPEQERTSVLTLYNVANSTAIVVGSAIGALILSAGDVAPIAYNVVYSASTIGRLLAVTMLWWFHALPRAAYEHEAVFQPLSLDANMGSFDQPVLTGDLDDRHAVAAMVIDAPRSRSA